MKWYCCCTQPEITLTCSTFGTFKFQKGQVITNPAIVDMYPNLFTELPELPPLQYQPAKEIVVGQEKIRLHPTPIMDVSKCGVVESYGNEPIDFVVATPDDPETQYVLPEESGSEQSKKRNRGRPFGSWGKDKREQLAKQK